ncbi:DNA helicase [Shigella phage Sd1]|uniref:DNA helicase n=1 Tax=Shigella phage Sd1 TaxID=2024313 RepID=A0A291AYM2_9CAUD|nr:ATP-dependent helicase [Shigella phage Sd1]ATE86080.1 DNA helicase [Shigella phage Sd1]
MLPIEKLVANFDKKRIEEIQKDYSFGEVTPYHFQCVTFDAIGKAIGKYEAPFIADLSVSAGKTIILAMIGKRMEQLGLPYMVLSRQSEIISQNSEELRNFGIRNSVYCAGLNVKSVYYQTIVASEGTAANGLFKGLGDYVPAVIAIDECHMVDHMDIVEAEENEETFEQMSTAKGEMVFKDGEYTGLTGTGRSQYTLIISEMKRRCREKYKRELRIFGLTGSPYRDNNHIVVSNPNIRGFWRKTVMQVPTNYLVDLGFVVPTVYGEVGDLGYDLTEFTPDGDDGIKDFSKKDLNAMEEKIHQSQSMTQKIMQFAAKFMETRNAALVTCSGKRHCEEAAAALPKGVTWAIVTDSTGEKKRREILSDASEGKYKFIFQIGCLTTGVNVPPWDTSIILRKVGSITLLIQLLGRGMRILKKKHKEMGMVKEDHVVLDFAGTLDDMAELYFDPIIEEVQDQKFKSSRKGGEEPRICPACSYENSPSARRCNNVIDGKRCEHFFQFRTCDDIEDPQTKVILKKGCGEKNDIVAKNCRCCGEMLIDPNAKLSGKMYRQGDWLRVYGFSIGLTKNQTGIVARYEIMAHNGQKFIAYETFFPESDHRVCSVKWKAFCQTHIQNKAEAFRIGRLRNARMIMTNASQFREPLRVTHRKNQKGQDIIANKSFTMED